MAITFPLDLPTVGDVVNLTVRAGSTVAQSEPIFTKARRTYVHTAEWWELDVEVSPMYRADAAQWIAFLTSLNGLEGIFLAGDSAGTVARGHASGTPLVKGAGQTGKTLLTDGWTLSSAAEINTLDPAAKSTHIALSNGNLTATSDGGIVAGIAKSTSFKSSGKWYCEFTITTAGASPEIGLANSSAPVDGVSLYLGKDADSYGYASNGQKAHNSGLVAYGAVWTDGNVISMLFDADADTLIFWKNGETQGTAYNSITGSWTPALQTYGSCVITTNFGATPFVYTAPAGYLGWSNDTTDVLKRGDWLQIGTGSSTHLHKVVQDVAPDISGNATLEIWPRLRSAPADNAAIVISSAKGLWRLPENRREWSIGGGGLFNIRFSAVEAL